MKLDMKELERVVSQGIQEATTGKATVNFAEDAPISVSGAVSDKKKFRITVEDVQGTCVACHRAGETFYMDNDKTPQGICLTAFSGLLPYINAMIYNADFPWEGKTRLGCPDPDNNVVFVIEEI